MQTIDTTQFWANVTKMPFWMTPEGREHDRMEQAAYDSAKDERLSLLHEKYKAARLYRENQGRILEAFRLNPESF